MSWFQIVLLALIQGAAELLPVSSSAHVIVAERLMGLDPGSPEMTFLLVMLHTGTMFAVLFYFWPRWKQTLLHSSPARAAFLKNVVVATAVTGIVGLALKKFIEKIILMRMLGHEKGEIEVLFRSLPLISAALLSVGLLIVLAGRHDSGKQNAELTARGAGIIGLVQGLCLPFRGFSRSGATISVAFFQNISRAYAEEFSFALAVVLTPPVVFLEVHRLIKASHEVTSSMNSSTASLGSMLSPGLLGMFFSFIAGLGALRWLSAWLEQGRWRFFGYYCIAASLTVAVLAGLGI